MDFNLLMILAPIMAIFFFWKLYEVLGTRDDHDRPPPPRSDVGVGDNDNVIQLSEKGSKKVEKPDEDDSSMGEFDSVIRDIRRLDSGFTTDSFLYGAKIAYEMIITAFAGDDLDMLRDLLDDSLYSTFKGVIDARRDAGESVEFKFVGLEKCDITDIRLCGDSEQTRRVEIVVNFVCQMVRSVHDKDGKLLEGDPDQVGEVRDTWIFTRLLSSDNPNWKLLATDA